MFPYCAFLRWMIRRGPPSHNHDNDVNENNMWQTRLHTAIRPVAKIVWRHHSVSCTMDDAHEKMHWYRWRSRPMPHTHWTVLFFIRRFGCHRRRLQRMITKQTILFICNVCAVCTVFYDYFSLVYSLSNNCLARAWFFVIFFSADRSIVMGIEPRERENENMKIVHLKYSNWTVFTFLFSLSLSFHHMSLSDRNGSWSATHSPVDVCFFFSFSFQTTREQVQCTVAEADVDNDSEFISVPFNRYLFSAHKKQHLWRRDKWIDYNKLTDAVWCGRFYRKFIKSFHLQQWTQYQFN